MASLACPRLQSGRDTHSIFLTIPSTTSLLVEPTVTVYPAKPQPLQHHSLLVCSVTGFYPGHIEVRWFRNGQEEEAGVVSTGLIPNGDWTFQTMVMLEVVPQSGEVYTCRVEHPSWTGPVTVEWSHGHPLAMGTCLRLDLCFCHCCSEFTVIWEGAQNESSQGKMLCGIGGFVLGLLFLGVGLFVYFRNQEEIQKSTVHGYSWVKHKRNFMAHMLSVSALLSALASCDVGCGVSEVLGHLGLQPTGNAL
ncbi:hypothetical protein CB1_000487062 [Camelus ferus]|nr:hypothetical protein CB1_000487062 [Camelus ferus]